MPDEMRIRRHRGYGHGLRPGELEDINCLSCQNEKEAGLTPEIGVWPAREVLTNG